MQHSNTSSSIAHEQAWILLPWYVNGTLSADERQSVEQHLKTCAVCQTEQADIQVISAYSARCPLPELSADVSFNRLLQRIEKESANETKRNFFPGRMLGVLRQISASVNGAFSPKPLWVGAVAVLLLAAVPATILLLPAPPDSLSASYRTLSSPRPIENAANSDIHIIFDPRLSQGERSRILSVVGAETVAGPNARGVYWIRLNSAAGARIDLDRALATLRRENGVLFAEPAAPAGASFSDTGARS